MKMQNTIFDISLNKYDRNVKINDITLTKEDMKSEINLIKALQKVMRNNDCGTYTIHNNGGIFARFDIDSKSMSIHKRSKNTGAVMPCWNHFEE